jgi:hypothetical protein
MLRHVVLVTALAALALAETQRLYLKDGSYQLTNQYEVQQDRVRYYSTERSDWEEIPLELVDLERTKKELADREAEQKAEAQAEAEERAAEREAEKQVASVPANPGVYYIHGEKLEALKQSEVKFVSDKKRTILKALSPIPLVPGKATVEMDGEHAAFRIDETRPEFYFRLSAEERFEIVRVATKKNARVVENLSVLKVQDIQEIDEQVQKVETFKKQEGDLLYKIWPEKPLEPGEYALIQYTEGKASPQVWDFSVAAKSEPQR